MKSNIRSDSPNPLIEFKEYEKKKPNLCISDIVYMFSYFLFLCFEYGLPRPNKTIEFPNSMKLPDLESKNVPSFDPSIALL